MRRVPDAHAGRAAHHADDPHYDDVVAEVRSFCASACGLHRAGIARDRIVLDPGYRLRQDASRTISNCWRNLRALDARWAGRCWSACRASRCSVASRDDQSTTGWPAASRWRPWRPAAARASCARTMSRQPSMRSRLRALRAADGTDGQREQRWAGNISVPTASAGTSAAPDDRRFRAAPRQRRGARPGAGRRHGPHRQGHASVRLHVRGGARGGLRRRRRRRAC